MTRNRHKSYLFLKELLGFQATDYSFYRTALRHGSTSIKAKSGGLINNERLEYLGDSVISLVVSDFLFSKYSNEQEGFLTKTRSVIVKRESLNQISLYLGVDKLLKVDKGVREKQNTHIYGSALEALVGAIYLDKGYESSKNFILNKILESYEEIKHTLTDSHNYKSILLEWCQQNQHDIAFNMLNELMVGKNQHIFTTQVFIDQVAYGVGEGSNKKESEQNAAKLTLQLLNEIENKILF